MESAAAAAADDAAAATTADDRAGTAADDAAHAAAAADYPAAHLAANTGAAATVQQHEPQGEAAVPGAKVSLTYFYICGKLFGVKVLTSTLLNNQIIGFNIKILKLLCHQCYLQCLNPSSVIAFNFKFKTINIVGCLCLCFNNSKDPN